MSEDSGARGPKAGEPDNQAALDRTLARYLAVFDAAPEGLAVTDGRGRLEEANRSMAHILQVQPTFLEQRPLISFIARRDCASFRATLGRAANGAQCSQRLTFRPRRKGTLVEADVQVDPILPRGGRPTALRWAVRPRQPLAFDERERERSAWLANVAHDLRSPLTIMQGSLDALRAHAKDADRVREYCGLLEQAMERVTRQTRDLLDFGSMASGGLAFFVEPDEDVTQIAIRVAGQYEPVAGARGVQIGVRFPESICTVACDRGRIAQALVNLVEYAIRLSPEGGKVTISVAKTDRGARVEVTDEGSGVAEGDLPRLFERYFRSASPLADTGLGLALAKEIVEWHGGRIGAQNRVEGGARLFFELSREVPRK